MGTHGPGTRGMATPRAARVTAALVLCGALGGCGPQRHPALRIIVTGLGDDVASVSARVLLADGRQSPWLRPVAADARGEGGEVTVGLALDPGLGGVATVEVDGISGADLVVASGSGQAELVEGSAPEVRVPLRPQGFCTDEGWCPEAPSALGAPELVGLGGSGPEDVWAVGAYGLFLHFEGVAWRKVSAGAWGTAQRVFALPGRAGEAWAAGGLRNPLRWDGARWDPILPPGWSANRANVALWAAGPGDLWLANGNQGTNAYEIWHLRDGALQQDQPADFAGDTLARGLYGFGPGDVWAAGTKQNTEAIWRNQGAGWQSVPIDAAAVGTFEALWGSSQSDVWFVNRRFGLVHWDGSRARREVDGSRLANQPAALYGTRADDVWLATAASADTGRVLRFDGKEWTPERTLRPTSPLRAVWGSSPSDVWVAGQDGGLQHFDGTSFQHSLRDKESNARSDLKAIWGSDEKNIFAAGTDGLVRRYDGRRWSTLDSGLQTDLNAIWGSGANDVWIAGNGGKLLRWDGSALRLVESGTSQDLLDLHGSRADRIFAVGTAGTLLAYDGGRWARVALPGAEQVTLRGVHSHSPDSATAVGDTGGTVLGRLYSYANGTWSDGSAGLPDTQGDNLLSVYGPGPGRLYVLTGPAKRWLLRYQDGKWQAPSALNTSCQRLYGATESDVWIACGEEKVLRWSGSALSTSLPRAGARYSALWGSGGTLWAVGDGGLIVRRLPGS